MPLFKFHLRKSDLHYFYPCEVFAEDLPHVTHNFTLWKTVCFLSISFLSVRVLFTDDDKTTRAAFRSALLFSKMSDESSEVSCWGVVLFLITTSLHGFNKEVRCGTQIKNSLMCGHHM